MTIETLGFTKKLEEYRIFNNLTSFEVGRVIAEHRERFVVKTANNEYDAELIGNLRYAAENRYELPAVGDWVAFSEYDENKALIQSIYPRNSIIERKASGNNGQVQIIAVNVDVGLIVQAVDRDFNLNRLERYLAICNNSNVEPLIVLSKIDLISYEELEIIKKSIQQRLNEVSVVTVCHEEKGYSALEPLIQNGKTYCLLGSSGVGKSTLVNNLLGEIKMETKAISLSVNKGKHTTSHRELIVLDNGGILIDNPGMREVGITNLEVGLESTFELIMSYAKNCRYKDCTHSHEQDCAILDALENGEINNESYLNFQKLEKEKNHYESSALERKRKDKDLGKLIKKVSKQRKRNKF